MIYLLTLEIHDICHCGVRVLENVVIPSAWHATILWHARHVASVFWTCLEPFYLENFHCLEGGPPTYLLHVRRSSIYVDLGPHANFFVNRSYNYVIIVFMHSATFLSGNSNEWTDRHYMAYFFRLLADIRLFHVNFWPPPLDQAKSGEEKGEYIGRYAFISNQNTPKMVQMHQ